MKFFDRLSNGWELGTTSFRLIREQPSLMIFPILSTASLIFICLTFLGGGALLFGTQLDVIFTSLETYGEWVVYVGLFFFYLVNFTVVVFFNVGLVHCARLIMEGKEAKVGDGISYSISRLNTIVSWAILAATVGVILRTLEERLGFIGQIVVSLVGLVWAVATFFVVPVIAYEDVTPFEAVKRSGQIMKEKWGEAIGANFSFGVFYLLGFLAIIAVGALLAFIIHPIVGIVVGVLAAGLLIVAVSAAETVFLAAAYRHVTNQPVEYFDDEVLDSVFVPKDK